jgi:hypothetical protein
MLGCLLTVVSQPQRTSAHAALRQDKDRVNAENGKNDFWQGGAAAPPKTNQGCGAQPYRRKIQRRA